MKNQQSKRRDIRIYADLNKGDSLGRIKLTCLGTTEDLEKHAIQLSEGMSLTFYMDDANDNGVPDDLIVDGVVSFDSAAGHWVATMDWSTLKHVSELKQS
jgi:hypothetical protein